ncbi:GGDEF domain-containing protein [Pseudooceanicola sp. MF1-13]|uniref:GGDEF domain-containing protein n=1 Tax=Pseudooceanicola sp. MF1-13 TaxID=3379095 RepID=UPI003892AA4C
MDRISTAEPDGYIAGAVAMLAAVPGVAFLLRADGSVLGGNDGFDARMREVFASGGPGTGAGTLVPLLRDVLGTDQPRFHRFALPDGSTLGFYCHRFEIPGLAPLVLVQEDRRRAPERAKSVVPHHLIKLEEEREAARAKERRLRQEAQHWRQISMTDRMTGLLNSTGFRDRVDATLKTCARSVLVYADLNGFKQVNDTLGHAAGDKLLKDMAETLKMATRATDLVGRVGGDEFAILLTECSDADRDTVVRRLQNAMARRFPVDRRDGSPVMILRVSAAMGYATYPDEAGDVDSLLILADSRMYADKNGKGHTRRGA